MPVDGRPADALAARVKSEALALGFDLVGIASARPLDPGFLREWIDTGRAAHLGYMTERSAERLDPSQIVPHARSVIALAVNYFRGPDAPPEPETFRVARYARGRDYHLYMRRMVRKLRRRLLASVPGAHAHPSVDTSAVAEKVWAELAGLGWVGRNGLLITPAFGSWVLLATLITDVELTPDAPHPHRCGDCRACLPACPTGAVVGDGQVDARRCLSTWTIETRDPIPEPLLPAAREHHFGCDACQDVCPWNRFAKPSTRSEQEPMDIVRLRCSEILALPESELHEKLVGSPLKRPGLKGFLRDVALGVVASRGPAPDQTVTTFAPSADANSRPAPARSGDC